MPIFLTPIPINLGVTHFSYGKAGNINPGFAITKPEPGFSYKFPPFKI